MKFLIKPIDESVKQMYVNHSTYHNSDSGLDLFIVKDEVIPAGETRLVDLGISCQLKHEEKYFSYNMYSRSSISKTPLRLANGVGLCDAGYLGPLKAALHNTGTSDYTVKKGERYVQLARPDLGEVSFELVEDFGRITSRNQGGFGSTFV
jgi:dUTP pyrophosphatase